MKHTKSLMAALVTLLTFIGTSCFNKTEKLLNNSTQNFSLASSDKLIRTEIETVDCNQLFNNKTSLGNTWIKCDYSFADKTCNASLSIVKGDLPLVLEGFIDIKGDFGCIDENPEIKFIDNDFNETTFKCYNKEKNCDTSQLLVFQIPISNSSEKIKAYKISDASRVIIQKSKTNFVELLFSETDKIDLRRKISCIAESLR